MRHALILLALGAVAYIAWRKLEPGNAGALTTTVARTESGGTVKVKEGANVEGLTAPVAWAVGVATRIFAAFGAELVVTSGNDGKHREDSRHYSGNAVDLRTRDLKPGIPEQITALLKQALQALGFDVVNEANHIHLEYDPKPGREWLRTVK